MTARIESYTKLEINRALIHIGFGQRLPQQDIGEPSALGRSESTRSTWQYLELSGAGIPSLAKTHFFAANCLRIALELAGRLEDPTLHGSLNIDLLVLYRWIGTLVKASR
jgi:hypothetical protein